MPDAREVFAQVARVLRPGGRFFFEEVTSHALDKWFYRLLMDHPTENRFSAAQFSEELERQGFSFVSNLEERYGGDFIFGVARLEAVDRG